MLEKQLLTIVAVIKKMQLKLKKNNISIEELTKLVESLKEYDNTDNEQMFEELVKTTNALKTTLDDNREELYLTSASYQERLKELSTSLELSLDCIKDGLKDFITIDNINKLENDIDKKIKGIKIEPQKEIEIGKVHTLDPGEEAKVEVTKTKDTYKLNFYIPRGVSGRGMPGKGVPSGGTTNQVLAKNSNDDYDTKWVSGGSGGTSDHSELTNLDYASAGHIGFQPAGDYALSSDIPTKTSELTNDSGFITTPYTLPTASTTVKGGVKVDGTTITIIDEVISAVTGGSGDVTGPTGATADNIAVFDGATGKIIKDSGKKLSDYQVAGTYSTDIHSNITALNAVSGSNTGDQSSSDFDIKDLNDSTSLRSTWSGKQDALGFTAENAANKENTTLDTSTTKYPTNRLTKEYADTKIAKASNVTAINDTGIADGEIAVFNLTNKDIRTSDKTIVTSLGADDTTLPTSKAVKDVTDGLVTKATYDANSILYATDDNVPVALTVGASTIVGRKSTGNIVALTKTETLAILNVEDGAEVNNISDANATDLTDSGATTLHKHSYNNLDDKPTIPTQYTDEMAQDAVGTILTDTTTIDFTYTDATPSITADVKDASVTYAKIQNVSATDKLLGRSSAGSGSVEEITCTAAGRALLDDADAATQLTTLGITSTAAELNVLDGIPATLTSTEIGYCDGVTSAIQTQINNKRVGIDANNHTTIGSNSVRATRYVPITPTEVINTDPTDTSWNDLDLSSYVSANAYAVQLTALAIAGATVRFVQARKNGSSITGNPTILCPTNVSNYGSGSGIVELDTNKIIEWRANNADISNMGITVTGYFEYVD